MPFPPLPLDINHWRSRWLSFEGPTRLHRVSSIAWDNEWDDPTHLVSGWGITVCGLVGQLAMPGIFSRMGADRCPDCCAALNIPPGPGAPYNADLTEQYNGE